MRGDAGQVAVGLGKAWALESDTSRGLTRLVRIETRSDTVERRTRLDVFEPSLAVGAGAVWILSGIGCKARGAGSCASVDAINPKTLRRTSRTIIRTRIGTLVELITVGAGAVWVSDAGDLAAARPSRGTVWKLDPRTKRIVARIRVPRTPLALAAGERRVWIADTGGRLRVLDARTNRLLPGSVALGSFPSSAIAVAGGHVWAVTPGALLEVDGRRLRLVRRIRAAEPLMADIAARGHWVWIATSAKKVIRVDARNGALGRPLTLLGNGHLAAGRRTLWASDARRVLRIANWPGWGARPKAPACSVAQLRASAFFQGATGSLAGGLTLKNTSSVPCTLVGFPKLRVTDGAGRPLPVAIKRSRPAWEYSSPPGNWPFQTLRPGKTSGFDIWWSNWCGATALVVFHVALPGGGVHASWDAGPRCDAPGNPSTMSVSPYGGGFGR